MKNETWFIVFELYYKICEPIEKHEVRSTEWVERGQQRDRLM